MLSSSMLLALFSFQLVLQCNFLLLRFLFTGCLGVTAASLLHASSNVPVFYSVLLSLVFSPNSSILLSTLCVASCPWTRRVSSPSPQVIARLVRTFILIPLYFILIRRKKSAAVHRGTLLPHRHIPERCPPIRWPSLFVVRKLQSNNSSFTSKGGYLHAYSINIITLVELQFLTWS